MVFYDCLTEEDEEILERRALQQKLEIYIEQLVKASEVGGDPKVLAPLYYGIASVHDALDQLSDSELYFRAAAHSFGFADEPKQEAQAWLRVGELRVFLFWLNAQDAFEQARRAAKRDKNSLLQAQALHGLGRVKQNKADFEGALADYESALSLVGVEESPEAITLRNDILEGMTALRLALLLPQAKDLAERTNRDAETPVTSPGDPNDPLEFPGPSRPRQIPRQFPGNPEHGGGPTLIWPRRKRRH